MLLFSLSLTRPMLSGIKPLIAAYLTMCSIVVSASAQEAGGKAKIEIAHPLGVVGKDTPVVLIAHKLGFFGEFKAGDICQLRGNDVVSILGTVDGKQIVQRTAWSLVKVPSVPKSSSCPVGAVATVDPTQANAWKAAAVARDAAKAVGKK